MAKAQKGDLIRITNVPKGWQGSSVGDIFEVINRFEPGSRSHKNGGVEFVHSEMPVGAVGCYVYDDQYEIHRKVGEEDDATVPAKATLHYHEKVLPRHEAEAIQDAVNSPNHYTQGRFETIEIIEEITQGYGDGYVAYCVGNALKYLARAPFKHGEPTEDIGKAAKYIEFALARLQMQK